MRRYHLQRHSVGTYLPLHANQRGLAHDDLVFHQQCHCRQSVRHYHLHCLSVGTYLPLHANQRCQAYDDFVFPQQCQCRHSVRRYHLHRPSVGTNYSMLIREVRLMMTWCFPNNVIGDIQCVTITCNVTQWVVTYPTHANPRGLAHDDLVFY